MNSVSKTIEELRLEWKNTDPVLMAKGLRMPQFEIVDIVPSDCQESFQIGMYLWTNILYNYKIILIVGNSYWMILLCINIGT